MDELAFHRREKGKAKPGPAFITETDAGEPWSGAARELGRLVNPQDISRLVVFDTWVRNHDRYSVRDDGTVRSNTNNVFLSSDAPEGQLLLRAMDHTHVFTNGRDVTAKSLGVAQIRDTKVYGLFPEFRSFLSRDVVRRTVEDLRRMDAPTATRIVETIPREWDVSADGRNALAEFITGRAGFLAADIVEAEHTRPRIMAMLWPQGELFPPGEPENEA